MRFVAQVAHHSKVITVWHRTPDIAIAEARKSSHVDVQGRCFFYCFSYFIRFGLKDIVMTPLGH